MRSPSFPRLMCLSEDKKEKRKIYIFLHKKEKYHISVTSLKTLTQTKPHASQKPDISEEFIKKHSQTTIFFFYHLNTSCMIQIRHF